MKVIYTLVSYSLLAVNLIHLHCVFGPAAQNDWNGTQHSAAGGKAPPQRQTKPGLREHPYGRY